MTSEGRGENYTSETEMNDGGEKEMETIKLYIKQEYVALRISQLVYFRAPLIKFSRRGLKK